MIQESTGQPNRGIVMKLAKNQEVKREGLKLTKTKPRDENYVQILRAINAGLNLPTPIVVNTKIPWLTAMQCLRTLEYYGFIETAFDPESERRISKLTNKGLEILTQLARIDETQRAKWSPEK